nr:MULTISPECIES: amidohydrolase family protein [unclassified Shinella]
MRSGRACRSCRRGRPADAVVISLEDALRMATANPSRLMGLEENVGFLRPGMPADIGLLDGFGDDPAQ